MKITFHGTRGSIAQSHEQILRYGGNTSCVEIRSAANDLIILDAGTGLHRLSRELLKEEQKPRNAMVLLSHTHWDHIQGLPFFAPFFIPEYTWNLFGPSSLCQDLETILQGQMQQTYFPITPRIFNANMTYHNVSEGYFEVGDIRVKSQYLNHPGVTIGYRIEVDGYTIVYSTDHEPHDCRLAQGGSPIQGSEDALHGDFLADADYVIHDAQYLAHEYDRFRGWGHSTMEYVVDLAHQASVKNLILFHHDPQRTDDEIDHILEIGRKRIPSPRRSMELTAASERIPIIAPAQRRVIPRKSATPPRQALSAVSGDSSPIRCPVLFFGEEALAHAAISASGYQALEATSIDHLRELYQRHQPQLILLALSSFEELARCYQQLFEGEAPQIQVALLSPIGACEDQDRLSTFTPQPTRLVLPISEIYLSSRLQTWASRAYHGSHQAGWVRAPLPDRESERAQVAEQLLRGCLKRESEQFKQLYAKTQQLGELAWRLLMLPSLRPLTVALNLITRESQENLYAYPELAEKSCSRDYSMCAHVVSHGEPIYAHDVAQHPQLKHYADAVAAAESEKIRSYVGFPLYYRGDVLGTLCYFSTHHVDLNQVQREGLQQITTLIEEEVARALP